MRHGAVLLNFSREGVVSDAAMHAALDGEAARLLRVRLPERSSSRQPGVIALPHLGASTREAEDNCAVMVVDQLRDYLEHGNVANAVNFPDVSHGARIGLPGRDRQRQRAQHGGPDLHRDGAGRPEHPQHGEQVARRDGLHAGRCRQRRSAKRCWPTRRIQGVLAVRYLPRSPPAACTEAGG